MRAADRPRPRPSRRPCPGSTRSGPGWSPPRTRPACRAPGTCSTTAWSRCAGTMLCVHGNPTWSYLWRRFLAHGPARLAGGRGRPAGHGLLRAHRRAAPARPADRRPGRGHRRARGRPARWSPSGHDWGGPISLGWALAHRAQLRAVRAGQHRGAPARRQRRAAADPAGPHAAAPARRLRHDAGVRRGRPARCPGRRCPRASATRSPAPYRTVARRRAVGDFVADIPLEPEHPSRATLDAMASRLAELADVPVLVALGPARPGVLRPVPARPARTGCRTPTCTATRARRTWSPRTRRRRRSTPGSGSERRAATDRPAPARSGRR